MLPPTEYWIRRIVGLLFILTLATGCYGVSSRHYFAMMDLSSPRDELTFYRVTIKATSFLTTSQYNAGFYDATALHQLFGDVKNPSASVNPADSTTKDPKLKTDPSSAKPVSKDAMTPVMPLASAPALPPTLPPPSATSATAASLQPGTVQVECDAIGNCRVVGGANDRFTVVYGANADALADQIRAFADSDNTGKQIASLLASTAGAETFTRASAADQSSDQAKQHSAALAKDLRALADQIVKATSADQARALLLRAAQLASQRAGSSTAFDSKDLDKGFTQAQATYEALAK